MSAAETHWPSLHPIHRSHHRRAVHWFADGHPGDRHHRPRTLRRALDCAGEKSRAHVFREGYRPLPLGVLGSWGQAAPPACVPGARLLGSAYPWLGHDRLSNVDKPRAEHDQVFAGGLWLGLPLMPTIICGTIGVPDCLDPLGHKSRITEKYLAVRLQPRQSRITNLPCAFLDRYFFTGCCANILPRAVEAWLHSGDVRSIPFCLNQRHGAGFTFILCTNNDLTVRFPMIPTWIRWVYRFESPTPQIVHFLKPFHLVGNFRNAYATVTRPPNAKAPRA